MLKLNTPSTFVFLLALALFMPPAANANNGDSKFSQQLKQRLTVTKPHETVTLFVYFNDKGDNIDQKLAQARSQLTPRSLERRMINRGMDDIVGFKDIPINPDYVNQISQHVSKIRHQLKALNAISVEAKPADVARLEQYDFVKEIRLVNRLKRAPDYQSPSSTHKSADASAPSANKNAAFEYGNSLIQNNLIRVPEVHDLGYDGTGVVVAVFDSGFNRLTHESFNQINIAGVWDFVNNDDDVGDSNDMGEGTHGTNTLSTIGGYMPGRLIGPAFGATFYLAKTENSDSELHVEEDNWCAAAQWADDNGAHIITSSLGYTDFDSGTDYSPADMDGDTTIITVCADLVAENGIVVINSAGNSGPGNGENTLGAPADGHFVLAVGAVTSSAKRSMFSSVGPSADGRIKPDVMAMGSSVFVASSSADTNYDSVDGTSFSCPLTAGVAALVLEANPTLTAAEVRDILRNSGNNSTSPDNQYGYGIIDALGAVYAANGQFVPKASFSASINTTTVTFSDSSSDSDGTITAHLWNFGDGNSAVDANPTHTYAADGTYMVTLTVTDSDGLTGVARQEIRVSSQATAQPSQSSGSGGFGFGLLLVLLAMCRLPITLKA